MPLCMILSDNLGGNFNNLNFTKNCIELCACNLWQTVRITKSSITNGRYCIDAIKILGLKNVE